MDFMMQKHNFMVIFTSKGEHEGLHNREIPATKRLSAL
jgi:hypothetical protein